MMYDWQAALRKIQHKTDYQQLSDPGDEQVVEEEEGVCNCRMWQAAVNLTTAEYGRAKRVREVTPQGLNNRGAH